MSVVDSITTYGESVMKAVRFYGKEDVRIEVIDEPAPGPGQVKLRNAFTGICGTDLHVFYNPDASGFDFTKPNDLTGAELPQVFGHEFSGTIVEVGSGVIGHAVGERVAVWPLHNCGSCPACRAGLYNGCQRLACQGISSPGGGMSTYTTVEEGKVFKLPDSVDLMMGALVEPMATGWHAVERSGVRPGQTALIVGAGPIGIGLWFALRAHGVDRIVVSEPNEERRAAMAGIGAEIVVDATPDKLATAVADATGGRGIDVAFEAAGVGAAVIQAISTLTPQGVLVIVALHEHEFGFNPTPFVFAENTIIGSIAYLDEDFRAVLQAMSEGKYSTAGWVSTVPFEGLVGALAGLRLGQGMKILVES